MPVINIDSSNYNANTITSGKVIVKVSSPTCGPCKMMVPVFAKLSEEHPEVTFCAFEVTSDSDKKLAEELSISSVPSFLIYQDGVLSQRVVGAHPLTVLKGKLDL